MKYSFFLILVILYSCNEPVSRKPIKHSTTSFYKELTNHNKRLNEREQQFIDYLIKKDSFRIYITSKSGFWYYYDKKIKRGSETPKSGDIVEIEYNIMDIYGNELYPKQLKTYKIDKEDFISALQDGIKLMKPKEIITFVIPSYCAYGVIGDGNKIGINQPIKSTVKLLNIKKSKK